MGGDYQEMKSRLPKESLIRRLLLMLPKDQNFDLLRRSLEAENYADAFRAAHSLKGVSLNLGLKQLAASVSTLTEILRSGAPAQDPKPLFAQVAKDYEQAVDAIALLDADPR